MGGTLTISGETLDSKLNGKQEKLENTSNLNIKSLNVLSDFGAIIVETAGQISCDILSSGTLSTNGDASIGGKLTAPSGNIELELIQTQMAQKPMLRAEVGMRVRCANKASVE